MGNKPDDSDIGILGCSKGGYTFPYHSPVLPQRIAWLMYVVGRIPILAWIAQAKRALVHEPSQGGLPYSTFGWPYSHTQGIDMDYIWRLFS